MRLQAASSPTLTISFHNKNAWVHLGKLPVINAIPIQMRQLFHNLISNALKFHKEYMPSEISVVSRTIQIKEAMILDLPPAEYAEIIFRDNGIGFSSKYAEKVFQVFQRLNTEDKYKGTGIGLALCRRIVSSHGGTIRAHSKENEGTAIHVFLPADRDPKIN
jgi:two-component system, chemotaxis family, CheB/CheR fusion protein